MCIEQHKQNKYHSTNVTNAQCFVYNKLEVLREHRPPPNTSIIELLNDFCRASVLCVLTTWQFFPDPNSDADRHQNNTQHGDDNITPQLFIKSH